MSPEEHSLFRKAEYTILSTTSKTLFGKNTFARGMNISLVANSQPHNSQSSQNESAKDRME